MKKILLFVSIFLSLSFGIVTPLVSAATQDSVCAGIGLVNDSDRCDDTENSGPTVNSVIHTVISIFSYIMGIAGIIMIILGSFKYITSGGDSAKVGSAKSTIVYALIGLVVAVLAQVLVRFVFREVNTIPPDPVSQGSVENGDQSIPSGGGIGHN
jgi:hypothetical protein